MTNNKSMIVAASYFLGAAILTGTFISQKFCLYSNVEAMILSGCIAGGKWLLQIVAALFLLKAHKGIFLRRIGLACLVGAVVLYVYNLFGVLPMPIGGFSQFVVSIALSVVVMTALYYRAVRKTGLPVGWFFGWLVCLVAAVVLQWMMVF